MKAKKCWVLAISIGLFIAASPVMVVAETKSEINDVEVLQTKIRELEQTIETQEKVITELKATCEELKEELKLQITENGKLKALSENHQKKTSAKPEESQQQEPVQAQRKARWANTDSWRHLSIGADESTVRRLLGEPKYIQCGSSESKWFYQSVPDLLNPVHLERIGGCVSFKNTNFAKAVSGSSPPFTPWRPEFTVSSWKEPIWESLDTNSAYEAKTREKSTLERRRAKWEDSSNWRKLKIKMRENEVRSLLGEPREANPLASDEKIWRYTLSSKGGVRGELGKLTFKKGGTVYNNKGLPVSNYGDTYFLESWEEPFWPAVERDLQEKKE